MVFSWDDFLAGCIGGTAGLIVGHPADTIKLRQQTLNTTIAQTIVKTYRHEGFRGFFKGMLFPLLGTGPLNAIFFGVYSNSMRWFNQDDKLDRVTTDNPHWLWHSFLAGSIGGVSTMVINCPIEVVKTVLQSRTAGDKSTWRKHYVAPYEGMWGCIKGIYRERGVTGFYKGGLPLMCRDVPSYGIYTFTYEAIAHWEAMQRVNENIRVIFAGGMAGVMAWVTVMPVDFVKSRIQSDNPKSPRYKGMWDCIVKSYRADGVRVFFSGVISWAVIMPLDVVKSRIQSDDPFQPQYKGMFDCFKKSYKTDGWRVFTRGFGVVALRAFPVNGAVFVTYEKSLQFLRQLSFMPHYE